MEKTQKLIRKGKGEYNFSIVIDGGFLYQLACAYDTMTDEDEVIANVLDFIRRHIFERMGKYWNGRYVMCLEGKNNFRYKVHPGYKSKRKLKEKPRWLDTIHTYFREHGAISWEGLEADDTVVIIHRFYENLFYHGRKSSHKKHRTCIVSSDKDLINGGGHIFKPYHSRAKESDFFMYVEPLDMDKHLTHQMMLGDGADEIPGLPQIGEKRANDFLLTMEMIVNLSKKHLKTAVPYDELVKLLYKSRYLDKWEENYLFNKRLLQMISSLDDERFDLYEINKDQIELPPKWRKYKSKVNG